jgi:hypothetical protein
MGFQRDALRRIGVSREFAMTKIGTRIKAVPVIYDVPDAQPLTAAHQIDEVQMIYWEGDRGVAEHLLAEVRKAYIGTPYWKWEAMKNIDNLGAQRPGGRPRMDPKLSRFIARLLVLVLLLVVWAASFLGVSYLLSTFGG